MENPAFTFSMQDFYLKYFAVVLLILLSMTRRSDGYINVWRLIKCAEMCDGEWVDENCMHEQIDGGMNDIPDQCK